MTTERSLYVRMPANLEGTLVDLEKRADAALQRADKLPPGDRSEFVRFEALKTAVNQLAAGAMAAGEPYVPGASDNADPDGPMVVLPGMVVPNRCPPEVGVWAAQGHVVVELRLPHGPGETQREGAPGAGPPRPASRWASPAKSAKDAMHNRFEFLLSGVPGAEDRAEAAIRPSRITNSVLTETLRKHAAARAGQAPYDLPVVYEDGSHGPPFPLHTLAFEDNLPDHPRVLRFTLLSIRHVEMDGLVHGAWLRNSRISRPRAMGLSDRVAYEISKRQLVLLGPSEPTTIHMYQTGFPPALIGFYRAVVEHLQAHPGSIAVAPHYFRGRGGFEEGTPWTTA